MPAIDHDLFLADLAARTGVRLTDARREAFEFLLARLSRDAGFTMLREAPTCWRPCSGRSRARSCRSGSDGSTARRARARGRNQDRYWRTGFYDRGYVQIAWDFNYAKAGARLAGTPFTVDGVPFVVTPTSFTGDPDLVLHPRSPTRSARAACARAGSPAASSARRSASASRRTTSTHAASSTGPTTRRKSPRSRTHTSCCCARRCVSRRCRRPHRLRRILDGGRCGA